jgi:tetratricopeptide (TPR) repeat protein
MQRSRAEVTQALELDESLAEAHTCLASILLVNEDFAGSRREALRALELNPSLADPYRWLAQLAAGTGAVDEAVRLLETARQIDPLDINVNAFLGRAYFYSGRGAQALAHWERTKSLVAYRTNQHLTEYYLGRREYSKAEETLHEMERLRPTNEWTEMFRGYLAACRGDPETARREIERLESRAEGQEVTVFMVGFIRFALGEVDAFFDAMRRSRREGSEPVSELQYSPLFDSIRADPRYLEIVRKWREDRIPDG